MFAQTLVKFASSPSTSAEATTAELFDSFIFLNDFLRRSESVGGESVNLFFLDYFFAPLSTGHLQNNGQGEEENADQMEFHVVVIGTNLQFVCRMMSDKVEFDHLYSISCTLEHASCVHFYRTGQTDSANHLQIRRIPSIQRATI